MTRKVLYLALTLLSTNVDAQIRLPRLVRDSMILQRDMPVKLWGWASPGERVRIRFQGKQFKATTAVNGKWSVQIPALQAGGPYTMDIEGNNHITLRDVLVGDVWICSGQSNMVHQMSLHSERYASDIVNAMYPDIREFRVPVITDLKTAHEDLDGGYWKAATPQDVQGFSAVAYFFARDIYQLYHVPIGLIN
ncbi:MAG TPA: hypothetical protein VJ720_01605, partial [Chitinophaga sp.]|nr:hypothetical protein [Chitinophaga sp.]